MRIPTIANPVFTCSKCGKKEAQGGIATGIPNYWICSDCRAKMKKIIVTRTIYEDGYIQVSGDCDFCSSFPCIHVNPSGEFDGDVMPLPPKKRVKWIKGGARKQ